MADDASLDDFFLLMMGFIVFLMQCGFAFLETGAVRSKNATNILLKNMLDSFLGFIFYWLIGYALAYGEGNVFCGEKYWALHELPKAKYSFFFFQFVFAATAATIVSGAVAERCELIAYFVYSIFITGFIYPVVSHWAWDSRGWLAKGYDYKLTDSEQATAIFKDFAGSGVVHLTGGICAMVGAAMLGPRLGRFDASKRPRKIRGHSVPLAALGGFILFFGFFAFNGGSQGQIAAVGDGPAVSLSVVNTMVSGSFGGLTALWVGRFVDLIKKRAPVWSLLNTINGGLTGMVAICAGCNILPPWGAAITGFVAGLVYMSVSSLLEKAGLDDPLDAVAVHAGGGIWGLIAAPLIEDQEGILFKWDKKSGMALGWNLVGALAIIAWSGILSILLFGFLRVFNLLRVSKDIERKGMDYVKHGEPAYPLDSYGDGWDQGYKNNGVKHRHILPATYPAVVQSVPNIYTTAVPPKLQYYPHNGQ